jgi:translocation and assembly module TamB
MLENPNILSYLIRGKGLDASSDEDNSVILTNALLGYGLGRSADAVSKIGDAFGVDDLQLGTQGQGEQTQIGVSGKLNDRLSIEYRVGVFSAITEFGLRYQWLPNLYLEATSGASNALDVFYEIKWGERQLPEEQATNKPSTNNPKK